MLPPRALQLYLSKWVVSLVAEEHTEVIEHTAWKTFSSVY